MTTRLIIGDCRAVLATLDAGSVHCLMTSPPFFRQRDYDVAGQIGLEQEPEAYIAELVAVFDQARRVLRPDGVAWVNLGDTMVDGHLLMIPARVAIALQGAGWVLRSDCIRSKPNPLPDACASRPGQSHEHVLMLTKQVRGYFFDADAVKGSNGAHLRNVWNIPTARFMGAHHSTFPPKLAEIGIKAGTSERGCCPACGAPWQRMIRKGGLVSSGPNKLAVKPRSCDRHTYDGPLAERPRDGWGDLPRRERETTGWRPSCTCPEAPAGPCVILDPFAGSGTVGLVADRLGRDSVLIDLSGEYVAMAQKRVEADAPLFASVEVEGR